MSEARPGRPKKLKTNPYPLWAPRFWHGMLAGPWFGLMWANRCRIHPLRLFLAFSVSCATLINSSLRVLQEAIFSRRLAKVHINEAPIFVIGHWRSGTTLLHELMVLDDRFTYPTYYQCFAPNHFLISKWFFTRVPFMLPARRPMDNMVATWDRPQEDEFAMVNMGIPSPYRTMAFPNHPPQDPQYFDLERLSAAERTRWQQALVWFLTRITYVRPRRIVLKSPPHMARLKALLEVFPDARFVHIVRDPYVLFPSTIRLWTTLYKYQALQEPRYEHLRQYVFDCFEELYRAFEAQRQLVDPSRIYEIRYEDLVHDMVGQMRAIYEHLGLDGFDRVLPKLEAYQRETSDYQTNTYELDQETRDEIDRRWGSYLERFGYCRKESVAGKTTTRHALRSHGAVHLAPGTSLPRS